MFNRYDDTGRKPREAQEDTLRFLEEHWNDYDVFSLSCPTGAGKSFLARTIQLETGAPIITCSNDLASQYRKDYDVNVVAGNSNYISAQQYQRAKERAASGEPTIYNPVSYKLFKDTLEEQGRWLKPRAVVLDEADQFLGLFLSMVAKKIKVKSGETIRTTDEALEALKYRIKNLRELISKRPNSKAALSHEATISSYEEIIKIVKGDAQKFAISFEEDAEGKHFMFIPIEFPHAWVKQLFSGSKVIMMSSTLFIHDIWDLFGRDADFCQYEMPSPIPVERRKIFYRPVEGFQYPPQYDKIFEGIESILMSFRDRPALIHTTYREAEAIQENFHQMMTHSKGNKTNVLQKWKEKGGILLGSGMYTGLDLKGDLCRLNVILKGQFPSMGDLWVAKRSSQGVMGSIWYQNEALRHFIQAAGRGVRSADDYCTTVFCDERLYALINNRWDDLPEFFKEAIVNGRGGQ